MFLSCKTSSPEPFTGYSYDPDGVTDTRDREIENQQKRTIGFMNDGVWISNEFEAARANNISRIDKHHYKVEIKPEISPVNNSPWYGFYIWADEPTEVVLELAYPEGRQRYTPKISRDRGESWKAAGNDAFSINRETNRGIIHLSVDESITWISAQEVYSTDHLAKWLDRYGEKPFVQISAAGTSHEGRPVKLMKISGESDIEHKGVILIYNRQHPPEVPGFLAGMHFLETVMDSTELAIEFRNYFDVWAFPMINPDGVDKGHWRTNAAGVDLNRDWQYFRQPETAAVRDALLQLKDRTDRTVYYGIDFHSTGRNLLYPILEEIETFPHRFTYQWADSIKQKMPWLNLGIEPFDVNSPIAKNWTYKTFGADAVTFEVWDELPREKVKEFGVQSAIIFMQKMIGIFREEQSDSTKVSAEMNE